MGTADSPWWEGRILLRSFAVVSCIAWPRLVDGRLLWH
jgi:hypothetical protein